MGKKSVFDNLPCNRCNQGPYCKNDLRKCTKYREWIKESWEQIRKPFLKNWDGGKNEII